MPTDKFRQRNPKNKQTKFQLVFDEESRSDFLTGFQKRKKARKKIAQQELEEKRKEGRRKEKQERREAMEEELKSIRLPETESKPKSKKAITLDRPEHTVTITSVTSLDLRKEHGGIGDNQVEYEDASDNEESEQDNEDKEVNGEDEEDEESLDFNDDNDDSEDGDDAPVNKRLRNDDADEDDNDHHRDRGDNKMTEAKSKKKAIMTKRRQQMQKQASKRKRGASQQTVRKMKSMKRKSLGKYMKRGSAAKAKR